MRAALWFVPLGPRSRCHCMRDFLAALSIAKATSIRSRWTSSTSSFNSRTLPLARSLKFLVVSLAELAALGVAFVSLRDNLDLSTPMGRFTAQLLRAMAEFEKELIRERQFFLAGSARLTTPTHCARCE